MFLMAEFSKTGLLFISLFCASGFLEVLSQQQPSDETQRGDVILQLFQWKWVHVGQLCTQLPEWKGIKAVQVSPTQPHRIINRPLDARNVSRPWWETYQPTGFRVAKTRLGTAEEFKQMVQSCSNNGIDVYSEIVINHLTALDAGTSRDSDGQWFQVKKGGTDLTVWFKDGDNRSFKRPICSEGILDVDCFPVLPYTSGDDASLFNLFLLEEELIPEIRNFIKDLKTIGVKGISIISAGLSSPTEIQRLLTDNDLQSDLFVNLELSENIDAYSGIPTYRFNSDLTSSISSSLAKGLDVTQTTDNIATVFEKARVLKPTESESALGNVIAFDHHERKRATKPPDAQFDMGIYSGIADLNPKLIEVAALLALLMPRSYGVPRLIWDYEPSDVWVGPPSTSPLTSTEADNKAAVTDWQRHLSADWVKRMVQMRSEMYAKETDAQLQPLVANFTPIDEGTLPDKDVGYVVFMFGNLINTSLEDVSAGCPIMLTLVASHLRDVDPNKVNATLKNGRYKSQTDIPISLAPLEEVSQLDKPIEQEIPSSNVICGGGPVKDCPSVKVVTAVVESTGSDPEEGPQYAYEIEVLLSAVGEIQPTFVVFNLNAFGVIPCDN